MAQIPKLELNIAIVDADELLREVRENNAAAQRAYKRARALWFVSAILGGVIASALYRCAAT